MRAAILTLLVGVLLAFGVDTLLDATQARRDRPMPGTRTELVVDVRAKRISTQEAIDTLWDVCEDKAQGHRDTESGSKREAGGRFSIIVSPALGPQSRRQVTGCLEDLTLDGIQAKLISIRQIPDSP